MTKKLTTLGMLIGAAAVTLPSLPSAHANTVMVQQADPEDYARTRIRNGIEVLRPTDEEHTPEQASFAFDPVQKDKGIVVMMNTGRLNGPAGANLGDQIQVGNIQGACMPLSMVQDTAADSGLSLIPDVANFKYVSQRNSDENRAYHHPEVEAIGGGRFAITANWDRNNNTNTERYVQVVDSQCNLIPLTANVTLRENNTSAVIMAKNNDNCSGRQGGGGGSVFIAADGTAGLLSEELCNGNGRDDGWANYFTVSCAADGSTCDVQKKWDTSVIDQEERSRGRCEMMDTDGTGSPDLAVCTGTEGNSQPQRDGVWAAGVDMASGDLLWKEQVAYRGETASGQRTYAMRIKMLAERTIDNALTGKIVMQYQMHRGNNNNNKKGGYDDKVLVAVAVPTRNGLNMQPPQDITSAVITSQVEMTHAIMYQTFTGPTEAPVATYGFLAPNHNGGGGVNSTIMNVPVANDLVGTAGTYKMSGPMDGQKYSKYLGNNPNNQGRNYTDCHIVANPFMAAPGSTTANIPVVNMCALTGKLSSVGVPSMKPDLFFEIWTSVTPPAVDEPGEEPTPDPGSDPTPEPGDDGSGSDNGSGTGNGDNGSGFASSGGCSTGGSSTGGFSMLLLGLAMFAIRRKRSL